MVTMADEVAASVKILHNVVPATRRDRLKVTCRHPYRYLTEFSKSAGTYK